jgi:hypothetical protein
VHNPGGRGETSATWISTGGSDLTNHPQHGLRVNALGGLDAGQPDDELAAVPRPFAEDLDAAAVQIDQATHEGEPHTEPGLSAIQAAFALHGQVEHVREQAGRDADSGVGDPHDRLILLTADANADRPAR